MIFCRHFRRAKNLKFYSQSQVYVYVMVSTELRPMNVRLDSMISIIITLTMVDDTQLENTAYIVKHHELSISITFKILKHVFKATVSIEIPTEPKRISSRYHCHHTFLYQTEFHPENRNDQSSSTTTNSPV